MRNTSLSYGKVAVRSTPLSYDRVTVRSTQLLYDKVAVRSTQLLYDKLAVRSTQLLYDKIAVRSTSLPYRMISYGKVTSRPKNIFQLPKRENVVNVLRGRIEKYSENPNFNGASYLYMHLRFTTTTLTN